MKIFSSVWLHYENCCRKYFHVFGSILKMLFTYKFFKVSQLFSQHPNNSLQKISKSQSQPQIFQGFSAIYWLFSQRHYHTTTTTTKIKITERDRWVKGEIARRRDRAARCCSRCSAIGEIWCMWSLDWSSRFAGDVEGVIWALSLSLSLSLSAHLTRKWFEVKIRASNHICGQSLILHGQLQITFRKFIFHAQPNTHFYGKAFPKMIWNQNKHSLNVRLLDPIEIMANISWKI